MGEHRGPDWLAEAQIGSNVEMRTELFGGGSMEDFNTVLDTYMRTGDLPEGRAGEVLKNLEDLRGATMGEFDIKDLLAGERKTSAGYGVDKAKRGLEIAGKRTDLLELGYGDLDLQEKGVGSWLEGNLFSLQDANTQTFQKTGGIVGPTRGAKRARGQLKESSEQKYEGIELGREKLGAQIDLSKLQEKMAGSDVMMAQSAWTTADLQGDLLGAERASASASMDQDRINAMNEIKDLLYQLETSELQFG